jgi:hypothetical protein
MDTNSIIYALNSGLKLPENNYFVSVITEIELLSYHKIKQRGRKDFKTAISKFYKYRNFRRSKK